ncbi:hypothetical protein GA707_20110 [Nostocoides sp. F2B08]|uniref:hypothetical protein n=1 Tax=Nostocoides sp. F2B08 TaxID=2653936 RepID=UPI0012633B07|nr:hypothetical protein [Tetrasphaera sp. F2B08]KAB7739783.1 hypothetical protein GA707_20110 [Tetrasphaera sp. F2B08]
MSEIEIEIKQVDERDSSWEDSNPRFRVYFHGSGPDSTHGWTDTYDVTGADVLQVIDWAQRQAGQVLTYAIALVRDYEAAELRNPGHGRGLIWLVGCDGNDSNLDHTQERRSRMLTRRTDPVGIPGADSMPLQVLSPYTNGADEGL